MADSGKDTHEKPRASIKRKAAGDAPAAASKTKRAKPKKDPNAPKRPKSAYMFFSDAKRPDVMAATPGIKVADIGRELGALWKELSDAEKKPYIAKAEEDKIRYQKASEAYKAGGGAAGGGGAKGGKGKKKVEEEEEEDEEDEEEDEE